MTHQDIKPPRTLQFTGRIPQYLTYQSYTHLQGTQCITVLNKPLNEDKEYQTMTKCKEKAFFATVEVPNENQDLVKSLRY